MDPTPADPDLPPLLARVAAGDTAAWQEVVQRYHARLRRMVSVRLDQRLQGRIDPSDVLQETYVDVIEQLSGFLQEPKLPFFLWLRLITGSRLAKLHRYHLGTQMRDASRDVSLFHGALPEASSAALARHLIGDDSQPADLALRAEQQARVQGALLALDDLDREVLCLRHFEQLNSAEVGQVLGISHAAAGKRYLRALARIRDVLGDSSDALNEEKRDHS